jgi:uncharacterized protein YjbI with pentapeptide repeats
MANPEHVKLARQTTDEWNRWRAAASEILLDLSGADLSRTDLCLTNLCDVNFSDADLREANLSAADLSRADLSRADLRLTNLRVVYLNYANLSEANLSEADLRGADLSDSDLSDANLSGANLGGATLREAKLHRADLSDANLSKVNLSGASLTATKLRDAKFSEANLSGADLRRTEFAWADLKWANLSGADLSGAVLFGCNLIGANLIGANLRGANLRGANLSSAKFREANLNDADLTAANLIGADLSEADLTNAHLLETIFGNTNLLSAKGLANCNFVGPCTLDHRTIQRSGSLPLPFLRGCGLPDSLIEYLPSLLNNAIQFFSCFISYSHSDKPFAKRLFDTLQGRGIRCWLDEKQLLPGDDIYDHVDKGIRHWDKILLCCSEASLRSWWVDNEIGTALEKEQQLTKERGEKVLAIIPLNLDGYIFGDGWKSGYRAQIRRRLTADFRGWDGKHETFELAVQQVILALRSDEGAKPPTPRPKL